MEYINLLCELSENALNFTVFKEPSVLSLLGNNIKETDQDIVYNRILVLSRVCENPKVAEAVVEQQILMTVNQLFSTEVHILVLV